MPYKCRICSKLFAYSSQLQCHECKHSGGNCRGRNPDKTNRIKDLDGETIINVHPSAGYMNLLSNSESKSPQDAFTTKSQGKINHQFKRSFECRHCYHETSTKRALQQHLRTHLGEMPFMCDVCGKGFGNEYNYQSHYRTHTGEKPYKCGICGKRFTNSSGLRYHERTRSGEHCSIRVGEKGPEEANKLKDWDGDMYVHPPTGYMNMLINSEHAESKSPQEKDDSTAKSLDKSPEIHNASTDVSGKMATRKQIPLSYNEENECMICGKKFQYQFILDSHLRAHSAEEIDDILKMFQSSTDDESLSLLASWEPYTCRECGHEYCTSEELKTHMLSHSAEEHQSTLSSAFEPETHFKAHSNVLALSSYTCKFCTRTFKKKYNWQIHMKTHTGERDYFCHFCAKTFWRKYNWKIHMKTHTGDRAYSCDHCLKSFITSSRLKFHVKSKHSYVSLDVSSTASGNLRKRIQDSDESVSDDEVNSWKLSKLSQDSHRNSTLEAGNGRLNAKRHDTDETLAMQTFTDAEQQDGGLETVALYSKIAGQIKKSNSQSAYILLSGKASMESYPPSSSDSAINGPSTATEQEQNISDQRRNKNDSKQNCHQINVKTQNSEKTIYAESDSSTYDDPVISLDRG